VKYPQMGRAARLLLVDQGFSSTLAPQTVRIATETPYLLDDGSFLTSEDCEAFEAWAATLSDDLLDIACCGCDETEPNGPITYTDGSAMGSKGCIFVVIPAECARVLEALFGCLAI
jgi:hypothetical protein